jgi:2-amino-4-hydroxy-6-hydroxymethyldihydropteridine diphosphokinase
MRKKGARNIDIDVVLFGDRVVDEPSLKIPHPTMHQRRFVLEPLVEIAPEARQPELGKTARELLAALPRGQIVRRL